MVTLASIGAEARQLRFGAALLACAWSFAAVRAGYREAKAADQAKRAAARQAAGLSR